MLDIERIKHLKSRCCRYIDTKQWSALRMLFAADARFEGFASAPTGADADTFITGVSTRLLKDAITVHHCHAPDIVFIDATTARGVWAMADYLEGPAKINLREAPEARGYWGFGHYEDEYRRIGSDWKIYILRLTRLRTVPLRDDHPAPGGGLLPASTDWLSVPDDGTNRGGE